MQSRMVKLGFTITGAFVGLIVLMMLLIPVYSRYQKRANAKNDVKVTAIQIQNQKQRVKIAKQHAEIRYQNSIGIREAQDEIAKTLTPLYVAFEMTEALKAIATSGKNNSVIYLPTNPTTGLPIVPTSSPQSTAPNKP
jgi:head-tail adaptor